MSDYKPLIWGIGIIFFAGLIIMAFMSPFIDVNDLEDNWTEDFGVVGLTGLVFDFVKYPVSAITALADFLGGNWFIFGGPTDEIAIEISGTGLQNGDSLDGTYTLTNIDDRDNNSYFTFKKERETALETRDKIVLETTLANESYDILGGTIFYARNIFYFAPVYTATGTAPDVVNNWTLTTEGETYTFETNATGEYLLDEGLDFSSITSRFWDFMDSSKEKAKDAVRGFGFIPEIIGVPIFLLIIIGIVWAIIKLLPFT